MHRAGLDFTVAPFLVIWETTQACDLACKHCRASAQPNPLPGELTQEEGFALLDDVAAMGTKICVLSGGDPVKRPDLMDLIRHGTAQGLRMATIPAATPLLTRSVIVQLKRAGLSQVAFSLDASFAEAHDQFRGVSGAFQKVLDAVRWAREAKLPVQINTVLHAGNLGDVDCLIALVKDLGIVFWEVFFLVPVGRGALVSGLTADQYEEVFSKLYRVAKYARFIVKVTEAPHFRRYCVQQRCREAGTQPGETQWTGTALPAELRKLSGPGGSIGMAVGVNAGKGFLFVSSTGEVYPSGFLPVSAGNVRSSSLALLYRDSPLFRRLRDPEQLRGRCGSCEFRELCGGSRSRAYALTGNYLAEDPSCVYVSASQRAADII